MFGMVQVLHIQRHSKTIFHEVVFLKNSMCMCASSNNNSTHDSRADLNTNKNAIVEEDIKQGDNIQQGSCTKYWCRAFRAP